MTQPLPLDRQRPSSSCAARARELGFDRIGVARVDIPEDEQHLLRWLDAGFHGEMDYMQPARHAAQPAAGARARARSASSASEWITGPRRPGMPTRCWAMRSTGYISRYALGRDYHKVLRRALARLAKELAADIGPFGYRVCVDSAPVLEKALARNAGLGWIGKHTNLISREAGSWFFLGEILTDLPLPEDEPASAHCGTCTACIPACPTAAIVAPYRLDARRCIAYLTIEHHSAIPVELRPAIGNRIYGCDDCQLVCPWNKFARAASHPDFKVRHGLDAARLTELFGVDGGAVRGADAGVGDLSDWV